MKKLLSLLGAMALTGSAAATVVACGDDPVDETVVKFDISKSTNKDLKLSFGSEVNEASVIAAFIAANTAQLNGATAIDFSATAKVKEGEAVFWTISALETSKLVSGTVEVNVTVKSEEEKEELISENIIAELQDQLAESYVDNDAAIAAIKAVQNHTNYTIGEVTVKDTKEIKDVDFNVSIIANDGYIFNGDYVTITLKVGENVDTRFDISTVTTKDLELAEGLEVNDASVIAAFIAANNGQLNGATEADFSAEAKVKEGEAVVWTITANTDSTLVKGVVDVNVTVKETVDSRFDISIVTTKDLELAEGLEVNEASVIAAFIAANNGQLNGAAEADFSAEAKVKEGEAVVWTITAKTDSTLVKGVVDVNVTVKETVDTRFDISTVTSKELELTEEINEATVIAVFIAANTDQLNGATAADFSATASNLKEGEAVVWTIIALETSELVSGTVEVNVTTTFVPSETI